MRGHLLNGFLWQSTRFSGSQLRTNERFYLIPHHRIAFNFRVRFGEEAVIPRIFVAMDRLQFVVKSKVPEDSGANFIGSANLWPTVESAVRLVEIRRGRNVGGDQFVILADLGNAIHLDGKENRDAIFIQLSREHQRFRSAPAHSVDNDAGVLLFFGRECCIMVGVEESSDLFVRFLPTPILKHFHMNP